MRGMAGRERGRDWKEGARERGSEGRREGGGLGGLGKGSECVAKGGGARKGRKVGRGSMARGGDHARPASPAGMVKPVELVKLCVDRTEKLWYNKI